MVKMLSALPFPSGVLCVSLNVISWKMEGKQRGMGEGEEVQGGETAVSVY